MLRGVEQPTAPKTGQTANTNTMTLVQPGARGTTAITHLDTGLDQTCVVAGGRLLLGRRRGFTGQLQLGHALADGVPVDPVAVYAGDNDGTQWGYRSPLYQQTVTRVFTGDQTAAP